MKLLFQGKTDTKVPGAGCVLLEWESVPAPPRDLVALRRLCFRQGHELGVNSGVKSVMSFLLRKMNGFARGLSR